MLSLLKIRDAGAAAWCYSPRAELGRDQDGVDGSERLGLRVGSDPPAAGLLGPGVARYIRVGQEPCAREPAIQRAAVRLGSLKRGPLPPRYLHHNVGLADLSY